MRWLAVVALVAACGGSTTLTPPPGAVAVIAQGTAFTTPTVTAPAGEAFVLWFVNRDNELHNVHIYSSDLTSVVIGQTFTGPAEKTDTVPALTAGTYKFVCDIHPQMTGQLVAR